MASSSGGIVRLASGAPWEPLAGYSRAVRAGDYVFIAGTTATDERGALVGVGQMYVQARQALQNICRTLERLGLGRRTVVRTRMFVTDMSSFPDVARAHREVFGDSPPASTLVKVDGLVHPDMLIEIEADAYAGATAADARPKVPAKPRRVAGRAVRKKAPAKKRRRR
jgi:enamine deaminase RidA (YjgF/YER057c/UK114 family)